MMNKNQLIIFIKNPVLGKVKTRLAKYIGDRSALQIYLSLLKHTFKITKELEDVVKVVYYSDVVEEDDMWISTSFGKSLQEGNDLGMRMKNAFQTAFNEGAERVVIIGSDCFELTQNYIEHAFNILNSNQAVIGPAVDGGYYLLGMNRMYSSVFQDVEWSTHNVFVSTFVKLKEEDIQFKLLPVLYDVDRVEDVPELLQYNVILKA
ncbi:MAG: glycosyltransferase [Flavobacteriales bacterium]|nr:glycosyltransferase [Flavobacteriales bacterium]